MGIKAIEVAFQFVWAMCGGYLTFDFLAVSAFVYGALLSLIFPLSQFAADLVQGFHEIVDVIFDRNQFLQTNDPLLI